jgi:hypothetical protein
VGGVGGGLSGGSGGGWLGWLAGIFGGGAPSGGPGTDDSGSVGIGDGGGGGGKGPATGDPTSGGKAAGGVVGYFGKGGYVYRPMGTDVVPAMLTPYEGVVNVSPGMSTLGENGLNAINRGGLPDLIESAVRRAGACGGDIYIAVDQRGARRVTQNEFDQIQSAMAAGVLRVPRRAIVERS